MSVPFIDIEDQFLTGEYFSKRQEVWSVA